MIHVNVKENCVGVSTRSAVLTPSKTSELQNDSDFQTASQVAAAVRAEADARQYADTALGEILNHAFVRRTAAGNPASFDDGGDALPVLSLRTSIAAVQSGSGTPASDNIRPISGASSCTVSRSGKNLFPLVSYSETAYEKFRNYDNPVIVPENGTITLIGVGSGNTILFRNHSFPSGTYTMHLSTSAASPRVVLRCYDSNGNILTGNEISIPDTTWNNYYQGFWYGIESQSFTVPPQVDHFCIGVGVADDTFGVAYTLSEIQLESGSTGTAYEPYVQPVTYHLDWSDVAGTVYGGAVSLPDGILTVTHGYIASYAGESLSGEWISDRDVYAAGTVPSTGAQVVYALSEPVTYQLSPMQIPTQLGANTFWCDTGAISIVYRADITTIIEKLLEQ